MQWPTATELMCDDLKGVCAPCAYSAALLTTRGTAVSSTCPDSYEKLGLCTALSLMPVLMVCADLQLQFHYKQRWPIHTALCCPLFCGPCKAHSVSLQAYKKFSNK